ncbi:MAG TPA: CHAT domain-containing protein [Blastocatellia bacterium]|nr:CHAT domain-containing protein [Blastocatellia bacterium]
MEITRQNPLPAFPKRRGVFISWAQLGSMLAGIVAIGLIGLLVHWGRGPASERGPRLLIKAFSKQRMIEPRLSGGFKGGAFNAAQNDAPAFNTAEVNEATELIENAFDDSNPYSRLAYGRMLVSKGGKGADALKHLRRAVAELPGKAEPHNDLGVCFMQQGNLEGALDEFNLALESNANMAEALFNRGLCYERLFLRDAASADYSQLLSIERDRSWMDEIKRRHEETSAPIIPIEQQAAVVKAFDTAVADGNNDEARKLINRNLEVLLKQAFRVYSLEYLKAIDAGDQSKADRVLLGLKLIGEEFASGYGDTSITDVTSYLSSLSGEERQIEITLLNEYSKAFEAKNSLEVQAAFEKLRDAFGSRQNYLFEFLSSYSFALCDAYFGDYGACAAKLEQTKNLVNSHKWLYRLSSIESQLGYSYSRDSRDAQAIKYCNQSIEHAKGAPLIESKALQYMANAYGHLGDIKSGLVCLRKSTSLLFTYAPQFGELASNSLEIAEGCRILGNTSLALLYAQQALNFAEQGDNDKTIAQADSFIAVERMRQNQVEEVDERMKRAFDYAAKIDSTDNPYNTQSRVLMRAGEIAAQHNSFESAAQYYSQAEAVILRSQEKIIPRLSVLRGRAAVYTRAKEYSKARADLNRASELIEDYRKNITEQKDRSAFLDASQSVFDDMIVLNAKVLANQREAFDISEKSRARTLLDHYSPQQSANGQSKDAALPNKIAAGNPPASRSVNPLTLTEVQKALPNDLRLVTYSVTNKGTFIYLVTRSGFESAQSEATTGMLDKMVQDYVSGIKRIAPLDELSEKARGLYRYLIGPIESRLGDGKRLCIVPDKTLHFLPFAALVDESGKYFIDSYRLTYAPSASVLVRCLDEARRKGTSSTEKMLAVGNPLFNKAKFPKLKELMDAEREATDSAEFYDKGSVVLNKEKATPAQVRANLINCDIAHLSLHCLVEERTPWLAALVLAEPQKGEDGYSPNNNGLLYLDDIYGMSLPRTRLVILSACESGLGQYYRGEGIVSLVRPFLALKVPTVIASLWSVDSQATAELMIDFHRERKAKNFEAGDALRNAQRNMAKGSSYPHPYYWAPFIMVGSNN